MSPRQRAPQSKKIKQRVLQVAGLALVIALSIAYPVWAQEPPVDDPHAGHAMPPAATPEEHSDSAAPGMRDPHAYSGGYTLEDGPYALPGPRQLRLMDEHLFYGVLFDRLEYSDRKGKNPLVYDAQAWYGRTYDRLVIKAEGAVADDKLEESRTELLWGHAIAPFWDAQLGVRFDSNEGADRTWLAFGVQGLAPYWFEVDASAYVGESGRTALRLETEYDLLLTQRLILQPRVELSLYGRDDEANGIGSGLSDVTAGVRLRYEFNRQLAPYIGVEWTEKYGNTADFARQSAIPLTDTRWVVGVRVWF